jgi:hypothetical protein
MTECNITTRSHIRKKGTIYQAEFTIHLYIIKPFLTKGNAIETIKKITSTKLTAKNDSNDTKEFTLIISGKKKNKIKQAWMMYAERHNKIMNIMMNLSKSMQENSTSK